MRIRFIILVVGLCLVGSNCYSQSKLMNAVKKAKVGVVHAPISKKPTVSTGQAKRKSTSVKTKPVHRSTVSADQKFAKTAYMEITGMVFANADRQSHIIDDYGSDLYAKDISYLKPKLYYRGLCQSEKDVTLDVKFFKDGTLMSGSASPVGYTYSTDATVSSGEGQELELSGWGNPSFTIYDAGYYKVEVWYEGNMLYQKGIYVKSGSSPVMRNNIMSINSVEFANIDKDDKFLANYGETLYVDDMRYLMPRINYDGLVAIEQNVEILIRIIKPDGILCCGESSPLGFTLTSTVKIKPGKNQVSLTGWGNSSQSTYEEGVGIFQIWFGENKIYQGNYEIKKKKGIASFLTVDSKTELSTTFGVGGGTETFYVKTDGDSWVTWGVPTWCKVKNKKENSFELECAKNTTGNTRSDYLKVKSGSKEVIITVRQN